MQMIMIIFLKGGDKKCNFSPFFGSPSEAISEELVLILGFAVFKKILLFISLSWQTPWKNKMADKGYLVEKMVAHKTCGRIILWTVCLITCSVSACLIFWWIFWNNSLLTRLMTEEILKKILGGGNVFVSDFFILAISPSLSHVTGCF